MKSVLISIQPQWCELILSGKKMIEVRKSAPKEVPFKAYIYMTATKERCRFWEYITAYQNNKGDILDGSQKVIGEFVCDKVDTYEANERGWYIYPQDEVCMSADEIAGYGKSKTLYGWHISDLKIYDKPKELGEFYVPCKKYNDGELHCMEWDCEHYNFFPDANGDAEEECLCKRRKPLHHPPRSWQYVE